MIVAKKEEEIASLLQRLSDTIKVYEEKLEQRNQKVKERLMLILAMSEKLSKEENKKLAVVDAEILTEMEKKWMQKEKAMDDEIERVRRLCSTKEETIHRSLFLT